MQKHPKHDEDFYGWAINTASLLKQKKYHEVDMLTVIQELQEMGASNKHELKNRLAQLIFHLLKWQLQPDFREISKRSWQNSIMEQRYQIKDILEESPSLKPIIKEVIKKAYRLSFSYLGKETPIDLKRLPKECPYTFEQLLNEEFFPD
jgi:hypothetical protein